MDGEIRVLSPTEIIYHIIDDNTYYCYGIGKDYCWIPFKGHNGKFVERN